MPLSRFFANKRRLYGTLAIVCAAILLASLPPWPGAARLEPLRGLLAAVAAGGLAASLMLWWAPGLLDTYPRNKLWRILLEGVPPLFLYMLAIEQWPAVVAGAPAGGMRVAVACVPVVLVLWVAIAFARYVRMLDELQQRLELQSLAWATAVVAVVATAVGFLHVADIIPVPGAAGMWILPLLGLAYALIRTALTRHYQ